MKPYEFEIDEIESITVRTHAKNINSNIENYIYHEKRKIGIKKIRASFKKQNQQTINQQIFDIDIDISDLEKITTESTHYLFNKRTLKYDFKNKEIEFYEYEDNDWVFEFNLKRKLIGNKENPITALKLKQNFDYYIFILANKHEKTYDENSKTHRIYLNTGNKKTAIIEHAKNKSTEEDIELIHYNSNDYHEIFLSNLEEIKEFITYIAHLLNLGVVFSFETEDQSGGKINLIIRQFPINKLKSDIFLRRVSNHMVKGGKIFPTKFIPIKKFKKPE